MLPRTANSSACCGGRSTQVALVQRSPVGKVGVFRGEPARLPHKNSLLNLAYIKSLSLSPWNRYLSQVISTRKQGMKKICGTKPVRVCAPIQIIPLHFRVLIACKKYIQRRLRLCPIVSLGVGTDINGCEQGSATGIFCYPALTRCWHLSTRACFTAQPFNLKAPARHYVVPRQYMYK